ncbi:MULTISPECIES: ion channel [Pseudomonas]|uniref:Potassium channel protein n=3 Tax=Pseudomonas TaxID=286 RepID=A0A0G3GC39_9PSED|nr:MULTISPECIES: ion channel [Pseudomonas]AKJ98104.1 potassium channel protein [Pseudomonas chlororaphis]KIQ58566.1 potassium channel protein [Pseudomonas fluorescens]ROM78639.1 potassium channel protein [Pseudomonas brassicacearum]
MSIFLLLRAYASSFFQRFGWAGLVMAVGVHLATAWIGLVLLGEQHLIAAATFIYFYLTTTLTVGYGDLSPQTAAGRIFVATWVMLGGIALLTAAIGKTTSSVIDVWRKGMKGKGDFTGTVGHTVLIGWEGASSERVIELLLQDETSNDNLIVICDCDLEENPMPGQASFIKGDSLSSVALLRRAGVPGAERVLVRTHSDDLTLATVLAVNQLGPAGHVVAHFNDSEIAALASAYAPSLECTSSMAIEMLVRASQDPGSSVIINELLCVGQGATQYLMKLPERFETTFGELYTRMKEQHNATLIGYRAIGAQHPSINPPGATRVEGGELFYIASTRLKDISNGMV